LGHCDFGILLTYNWSAFLATPPSFLIGVLVLQMRKLWLPVKLELIAVAKVGKKNTSDSKESISITSN
jgi:hypothetical protein